MQTKLVAGVTRPKGRHLVIALVVFCIALCAGVAAASAERAPEVPESLNSLPEAASNGSEPMAITPETNSQAAEELPHRNLDRLEAKTLLTSVFADALDSPTAVYSEVASRAEQFRGNHVAIVEGESGEGDDAAPATLLESVLPLRVDDDGGASAPVNLDLELNGDSLEPANPLVEVSIPQQLGDGIALPEAGIEISLDGAPDELTPSVINGAQAFYPNIATDTDLTIAPTPVGLETFVQLRTAAAPPSQTYELELPSGSDIVQDNAGGVAIQRDGQTIASVPPPTAIDAEGDPVPVGLSVLGHSITVSAVPGPDAIYPILVDPIVDSYHWESLLYGYDGWYTSSNSSLLTLPTMGAWGSQYGLNIKSTPGTAVLGSAMWSYYVPRYFSDYEGPEHERPTSYITKASFAEMNWAIEGEAPPPAAEFPALRVQLWASGTGAKAEWLRRGSGGPAGSSGPFFNGTLTLQNPEPATGVKEADVNMYVGADAQTRQRHLWISQATMELGDSDNPGFGSASGPQQWLNEPSQQVLNEAPIKFTASDSGLGVYSVTAKVPKAGGGTTEIQQAQGCTGAVSSPCPRKWSGSISSYSPATMPQGEPAVELVAKDAVGHTASKTIHLFIDHTKPQMAVSGTATEQASLGTKRPTYAVNVNASDGTAAAPQSGVVEVKVEVDGTVVASKAEACASEENCALPLLATIKSSKYSAGEHTIKITATDAVGLSTVEERKITLAPSPPALTLSGSMTEQKTLGLTRPRYVLKLNGVAEAGLPAALPTTPTFTASFGSTEPGKLNGPRGVAADGKGHVWVVDRANNRVVEFSESGSYISQFGTTGSGNGQFNAPWGIAVTPAGHLWVVDTGNDRIQEFDENGTFLQKFGTKATSTSKGTELLSPEGIAIAPGGMLWVSDSEGPRVAEFRQSVSSESERFVRNTTGTAATEPEGLAVDANGNVYVVDEEGNRVLAYSSEGAFIRSIGTLGSGNGQLHWPTGAAIAPNGNLLVADAGNNRIEEFSPEGTFQRTFSSGGSGLENLAEPKGIAVGAGNALFIADKAHNLVKKWTLPSSRSEAKTEIVLDGKVIVVGNVGCTAEPCSISREWLVQSSALTNVQHLVTARVTDGLGNTTAKTFPLEVQKDTTKPSIEAGGSLISAPEGWVEQEGYGVNVYAKDGGYGATSLELKIDGKQVAATTPSGCPDGGCEAHLQQTINIAPYSGGAHPAELIATDGAGNVAAKSWTMNVNPDGHVSPSELIDTINAVEETAPEIVELKPLDGVVSDPGAEPPAPTLASSEGMLLSENAPAFSKAGLEANEGFAVASRTLDAEESAQTNIIEVTPVETASTVSPVAVPEQVAAVYANTGSAADTVVHPIYDGLMSFQAIRDAQAPESFSWRVQLNKGESLQAIDEHNVGVFWKDGTQLMLISAEAAHGADGQAVETSLSLSAGNEITLNVHFHAPGVVYPVVAGVGWEGGYSTYESEFTSDPLPDPTGEWEVDSFLGAPEAIAPEAGQASASAGGKRERSFFTVECNHTAIFSPEEDKGGEGNPFTPRPNPDGLWEYNCGNPWKNDEGIKVHLRTAIHGKYIFNGAEVWHPGGADPNQGIGCKTEEVEEDAYDGAIYRMTVDRCVWWGKVNGQLDGGAKAGPHHHIIAVNFTYGEEKPSCEKDGCGYHEWERFDLPALVFYMYPNGHQDYRDDGCINC